MFHILIFVAEHFYQLLLNQFIFSKYFYKGGALPAPVQIRACFIKRKKKCSHNENIWYLVCNNLKIQKKLTTSSWARWANHLVFWLNWQIRFFSPEIRLWFFTNHSGCTWCSWPLRRRPWICWVPAFQFRRRR